MADGETLVTGAQDDTVTPETKVAETKIEETLLTAKIEETPAETPPEKKEEETKKAPEEYADFTLPEGIQADAETLTGFKALAKKHGLTQEDAQEFVDLQAKSVQAASKAHDEQFDAITKEWTEETKKTLGTDLQAELGYAARLRDEFVKADPETAKELIDILNTTHLGDHRAFVKFFAYYGRKLSEDKFEAGRTATGPTDPAKILFGTTD